MPKKVKENSGDAINKRILVFMDWYRPGYRAGGPVTSVANLVEHMVNHQVDHLVRSPVAHMADHESDQRSGDPGDSRDQPSFYILTRNTDFMDTTPYEGIEANRWIDRGEGVRVCYLSPSHVNKRRLRALAGEAACNTWYINGVYSWYFSIFPLLLSRRIKPARIKPSLVLVAPRGMLSPHALKLKSLKKSLFLAAAKFSRLYRGILFHATNQIEAEAIRDSLGDKVRVRIAPNLPAKVPREPLASCPKATGSLKLVCLARISPEKNTLQALKIIRRLRSGQVTLDLVGEIGPAGYWNTCKELIKELPPHIRVNYTGPVPPDKLPEVLHEYHMLFLPTTGENHGHAILECLSYGLPALISDQTPWNDLQEKEAGWAIPLDAEKEFATILEQCLAMDQEAYDAKSRAAWQYAKLFSEDPTALEMNQNLFSHE